MTEANLVHLVTLRCKDTGHANMCLEALTKYGRPDAMSYDCTSYEFGRKLGEPATVVLTERWTSWDKLDRLLAERVVSALPTYNALLAQPFDPERDTTRVELAA